MQTSREIHLRKYPEGIPAPDDFELVEVPVPNLDQGDVLVKNIWMSVDPYMRGRLRDRKSYVEPFKP
ncbi:MAG TPA: NADP-dependent oxidoreductase, partial [candidate division Zixibacteria bacterium]|nr:NADP-dependent oxidoreductase [candidate division Zixibacteria bacterium]